MNYKVKKRKQNISFISYFNLGLKKGIMELVDLIIITKADGELMPEVRRLQTEWLSAVRLMRRRSLNWTPKVNILFYLIINFN
jgi:LAO/AO transport system kinase